MTRTLKSGFMLTAMLIGAAVSAQAPDLSKLDAVERALPDGPVALVDDKPVSKDDYLFLYHSQLARMAFASGNQEVPGNLRVKLGISTLGELVQREIVSQYGESRGLKVTQAEIEDAYAKQMKLLIKEFTSPNHTPDEAEILERSGQTKADAHRDLYKALMVQKATAQLAKEKNLVVTDAEAREFYTKNQGRFQRPDTIHLKQIYTRPGTNPATADEKAWADAEQRIKNAEARFKVGDTFEGVAKSMSDGKDKDNGGDMGLRPAQALPPIYVEKARTMQVGDTSAPFKSEHGWHIIRLVAREGEANVPFEEASAFIKERLLEVKKVAAVEEYCQPIMADEERVQIFLQLQVPDDGAPQATASAPAEKPAPAAPATKDDGKKKSDKKSEKKPGKKAEKEEKKR